MNILINKKFIKETKEPKSILLFIYLYMHEQRIGDINFSISDFCSYWNYSYDPSPNGISKKIYECLEELKDNYLESFDIPEKISYKKNIILNFKKNKETNDYIWLKNNEPFVILTTEELNKIHKIHLKEKIRIDVLLLLFLKVKMNMNMASERIPYSYFKLSTLTKNIASKNTIHTMLNILNNYNLLYSTTLTYISKKDEIKTIIVFSLNTITQTFKDTIMLDLQSSYKDINFCY